MKKVPVEVGAQPVNLHRLLDNLVKDPSHGKGRVWLKPTNLCQEINIEDNKVDPNQGKDREHNPLRNLL